MGIIFNSETGLSVEETAVIRDAIAADWIAAFHEEGQPDIQIDSETPAGQLIDSQAALVTAKDSELLYLGNMFNPDVAEGRWQDALGKIYFITRKTAEPTTVTCQCTGLQGTVIPAGALARADDGTVLMATSAVTIGANGRADVFFQTQETGAIVVDAGTVNTIVTVIAGWDTVSNAAAGSLGRVAESRVEFENRRRQSVANNAHGSVEAIYSNIAGIDGVLELTVLENYTDVAQTRYGVTIDPHSILVSVYGGADADIAEAIYLKKSAGCGTTGDTQITHIAADYFNAAYTYNIVRPTATPFKIWVSIEISSGTPSNILDQLKQALVEDFYGTNTDSNNTRVGLASRIFASRFYVAIMKTAGVTMLVDLMIALGSGTLDYVADIPADVTPVLTDDDITIEYTEV